MSGRLVGEVFDHAPADLAQRELVVLLALADDARERDRVARYKSDAATLAHRVRRSEGSVRNALAVLTQRGLIRPLLTAHRGRSQEYELAKLAEHHRFNGMVNGVGKRHTHVTQSTPRTTQESVTPT